MFELSGVNYEEVLEQGDSILVQVIASSSYRGFELSGLYCIHNALYAKVNARKSTPPRYHVGDNVRIVRKKGTFEKGFTPNWTEGVFTITTVKATKSSTYTTEDTRGECAGNLPYRTSAQEGKGYSSAFNSWIPLADVEQL